MEDHKLAILVAETDTQAQQKMIVTVRKMVLLSKQTYYSSAIKLGLDYKVPVIILIVLFRTVSILFT